jgi:hypothetical protein
VYIGIRANFCSKETAAVPFSQSPFRHSAADGGGQVLQVDPFQEVIARIHARTLPYGRGGAQSTANNAGLCLSH